MEWWILGGAVALGLVLGLVVLVAILRRRSGAALALVGGPGLFDQLVDQRLSQQRFEADVAAVHQQRLHSAARQDAERRWLAEQHYQQWAQQQAASTPIAGVRASSL